MVAVIPAPQLYAKAIFFGPQQCSDIQRMIVDRLVVLGIFRPQHRVCGWLPIDGTYAIAKAADIQSGALYRPCHIKFFSKQGRRTTTLGGSPRLVSIYAGHGCRNMAFRPQDCPGFIRWEAGFHTVFVSQQQLPDGGDAALPVCRHTKQQRVFAFLHVFREISIAYRRRAVLLPLGIHSAAKRSIAEQLPAPKGRSVKNCLLQGLSDEKRAAEIQRLAGLPMAANPMKSIQRIIVAAATNPLCFPI